jgi:hypothetical protein
MLGFATVLQIECIGYQPISLPQVTLSQHRRAANENSTLVSVELQEPSGRSSGFVLWSATIVSLCSPGYQVPPLGSHKQMNTTAKLILSHVNHQPSGHEV